uniref:Uncharacterized protein n=2 Tax=Avena sativa TaxID=4498 RepID=A0ACD5XK58_AVESA
MWKPKILLVAVPALCVLACTVAGDGMPLVTAITKDAATSLYTAPLMSGTPLVLDLSGPIIWSTCPTGHRTLDCNNVDCMRAHRFHPPNCPHTGFGKPDDDDPYRCKCTAHPHNPVSGDTTSGDLTRAEIFANSSDGKNPLRPVSFTAVTSCAPDSLLAKLPAGAVGVAGLARSGLSFPGQVARKQSVSSSFALCLPSRGTGVAMFGGGTLFLNQVGTPFNTTTLVSYTPLCTYRESPGYFMSANKGILVNQAQVPLPMDAPLTIGLSSTVPYAELRPDVYRPFINAWDQAMVWTAKVAPPPGVPFELCYPSSKLSLTRFGYFVPDVTLLLDGGGGWTLRGGNTMMWVDGGHIACFAFAQMKEGSKTGYGGHVAPAMVIGTLQMEDNVVVFDEENLRLGFTGILTGRGFSCSNFNFTVPA